MFYASIYRKHNWTRHAYIYDDEPNLACNMNFQLQFLGDNHKPCDCPLWNMVRGLTKLVFTYSRSGSNCHGPRVATQTNNYRGLVQEIHTCIDYVHITIHIILIMFQCIWIMSQNPLYSRVSKEKREEGHREKLGRELGLGL